MNHTSSSPAWSGVQIYGPVFKPAHRYRKGVHPHAHLRPLVAAILSAASITTYALPTGGQVSAGQGDIAQSGSAMTVNQQSQNLAINWQTFNIGATESVTFAQPNSLAIALNRILGADPTQIYGRLSANGQVWLLNPNGVLFGGGAQVNVGGLVASTLNISDADFLAGKRTFAGSGGSVTNQGSISAADGGYVALLGGKVSNEGVIQARLGTVALGAGNQVTLDFAGDKLLNLQVDQGALNALAQNKQLIQADGGTVLLSARAADTLLNTVVNNTGIIEAHTIDTHSGTIKLLGGMDGGTVQVGGTLDASAPNGGNGGFIEASGAQVKVNDGSIVTTSAPYGQTGEWLIDPTNFLIAPTGGDITGTTLGSELNSNNVTIMSSSGATAGAGDIKVNDNVTWNSANSLTLSAYHNVNVVKTITNLGTGGVTLRADDTGNCVSGSKNCGTVSFTPLAHVTVNGGAVNIYYNPADSSNRADANGNGPSYANPTDYSGHVTLNGGSTLYAWMLVNDVNQLQAMNTNLGGSYALGRNVDASATAGWNGGAGFVPVGTGSLSFTGMFDGSGHVISGLAINRPATSMVGLFGANEGSIANVGLADASVLGSEAVGALVGYNFGGAISNSYSTGSVNGTDNVGGLVGRNSSDGIVGSSYSASSVTGSSYEVGGLVGRNEGAVSNSYSTGTVTGSSYDVGGLVGDNFLGTVSNSYSTGSVNGTDSVGGLVGSSFHGTVSNSYSTGSVNGTDGVGGLVGGNEDGMVSNSYSTGAVTGTDDVGGLVGASGGGVSNSYSTSAVSGNTHVGGLVGFNGYNNSVINSYSTGAVNGNTYVGGLVGYNEGTVSTSYSTGAVTGNNNVGGLVGGNDGTVSNSYWDTTTSGQSSSAGGTGLTTAQMMQQTSYGGFDFTNTWWMSEGNTRPFLRMEYSTTVNNAHQLQLIALNPNASYTLAHDIDMSELSNPSGLWNVSTGFVPLYLSGQFDGGGHVISGLIINRPATSMVGLFGANEGSIANVGLADASVLGSEAVGALVGYNFGGAISNSYSTGSVNGTDNVGGLVGRNSSDGIVGNSYSASSVTGSSYEVGGLVGRNEGAVSNSYSTGSVNGTDSVGGLVGSSFHGTVSNSHSTGSVNGIDYVGGLIGSNAYGMVSNSYSTSSVSGNNYVGGLAGASAGTVSNSYSTGAVSGNNYVGGLLGENDVYSLVVNSYSTGVVTGANDVGGLVGANMDGAMVRNSYSTGAVNGTTDVGGLVGYNDTPSSVGNSYSTGAVNGTTDIGGLVGHNAGTVSTSYSTGAVSGSSNFGGLVGLNAGTVSNSYWDITTSGQTTSAGGTGLTDTQMKQQASFVGFDFVNTWGIIEGVSYPFLLEP